MKKKIASMMLACLMVICLLPLQAGAAESVEKVTRYEDGSYTVTTVERYAGTQRTTIPVTMCCNGELFWMLRSATTVPPRPVRR